jgi:hypothetical protein
MKWTMNDDNGGSTLCRQRPGEKKKACRVVLGLPPSLPAANLADQFRMKGWDVCVAANGEDARRTAIRHHANVVVVPFLPNDPLATAKVVNAMPAKAKIVLVAAERGQAARFGEMIEAVVVGDRDSADTILNELSGRHAKK